MNAPPRVLITGGGGQLARALLQRLEPRWGGGVRAFARRELDVTDPAAVRAAVEAHRPDWIINCAAFTAVDAAERDREAAYRVNDAAVGTLADAALERGARLLHLSTDYVFDGAKGAPYVEGDRTAPVNVYGASKLAGEERLARHAARWAVLRTAWLYGDEGRNFLLRIIESGRQAIARGEPLPVVGDQVGSPTDVHTLALQVEEALASGLTGLFHAAAEGSASWHQFAEEIFGGLGMAPRLAPIEGASLGRPARRPARVVLENRSLKALGLNKMIHWREGLERVLRRLRERRTA